MSFPYSHPFLGLSNGLNTKQGGVAGVGGWVELGRTTLGSAGDDITVSGLSDKRYYMVLGDTLPSGLNRHTLRLNSDTGLNYAWRYSTDGAADGTVTSNSRMVIQGNNYATNEFSVSYIANRSANEKLVISHDVKPTATGATSAPGRQETASKWANTSNAVSAVTLHNSESGDFAANSELVVLGWDPADTHTNNFWEELASVELGSEATLSSGTFTAKKYLWVQIHTANVVSDNMAVYFNSDTSTNYSFRHSNNGGADGTVTSNNTIQTAIAGGSGTYWNFINMFIINNSANEKLAVIHTNENTTTGAGTAPARTEVVGKWANTSAQITDIKIADGGGTQNNQQVGSIIKVWGAN